MRSLKFKNSDEMPIIGLGTWKSKSGEVKKAVKDALKIGYRHIDCATAYGNETEVGEAINESIDEGVLKREDLWVTSKLWNDSHEYENVQPALEQTLNDLKLQYLDLYLIHWPIALKHGTGFPKRPEDFIPLEKIPILETWRAMEELHKKGLIRHIGVSNFSLQKLYNMVAEANIKPELNQVELHPYLQQPELVDYCQQEGINITGYSPLGSMDRPDFMKKENEPVPLKNDLVKNIAKAHNCTEAQVLLAWNMTRGIAVIPKSVHKDRIEENFGALEVELTAEDMKQMETLDKGYRFVDGEAFNIDGNSYSRAEIFDETTESEFAE